MPWLKINDKNIFTSPELIIFDKDGTLIDVHYYWTNMIKFRADRIVEKLFKKNKDKSHIFSELVGAMGIDEETGRIKPTGPVGIKPRIYVEQVVTDTIRKMGAAVDLQAVQIIFREVDDATMSELGRFAKLLPGVSDFLKMAQASSIKLAVGTSDTTKKTQETFRQIGILNCFHFIVGGDQLTKSKPNSELADLIIEQSSASRERTIVLGDHPVDIEMGMNAGIKCNIAVLTGLGEPKDFLPFQCPMIKDFTELSLN